MAEFTPITTQEQFDEAIAKRIERERAKFADYDALKQSQSEKDEKITGLNAQITELTGKVKKYETDSVKTRLGLEKGLPLELIGRITGETEEEIAADIDKLAKFAAPQPVVQPLFNPERQAVNDRQAALKELAADLFNKNKE